MDPYDSILLVGGTDGQREIVKNSLANTERTVIGEETERENILSAVRNDEPDGVIFVDEIPSTNYEEEENIIRQIYNSRFVIEKTPAIVCVYSGDTVPHSKLSELVIDGTVKIDNVDSLDDVLYEAGEGWRNECRATFVLPDGTEETLKYGSVHKFVDHFSVSKQHVPDKATHPDAEVIIADRTGNVKSSFRVGEIDVQVGSIWTEFRP